MSRQSNSRQKACMIALLALSFLMVSCSGSRNAEAEEEEEEAEKGSLRWRVKTLTDSDTSFIRFDRVVQSSIREQSKLRSRQISSSTPRLASETRVYELTVLLTAIKRELDGDYHLVLKELKGDLMMIAELPFPEEQEIIASGRAPVFRKVKRVIDSLVGIPPLMIERHIDPPKKIRLTGVGFFDSEHMIAQQGMLPNLREIHPILSIKPLD
jgi:hypothetical protein